MRKGPFSAFLDKFFYVNLLAIGFKQNFPKMEMQKE